MQNETPQETLARLRQVHLSRITYEHFVETMNAAESLAAKNAALVEEVGRLRALLREFADDLEAEINDRYISRQDSPLQQRRYDRDMLLVLEARAALRGAGGGE